MFGFLRKLFRQAPQPAPEPEFVRTGQCPICGAAAAVRFTNGGRGHPYESCDEHRIQAVALMCHQRGYTVIGRG